MKKWVILGVGALIGIALYVFLINSNCGAKTQGGDTGNKDIPHNSTNLFVLRDLEAYLKLAYSVNDDVSFKEFEDISKSIMSDEVYAIRVKNFKYIHGSKPNVEVEWSGYTPTIEGLTKYNIRLNVTNIKTDVITPVDCFIVMQSGKIIEYIGY